MHNKLTVFKYELYNVLRSKWLYCYVLLLALTTFGFIRISDNARKVELSLVNLITVILPLVSVLFTTTYWYNSERFTDLLLSQPVSRRRLYWSRLTALVCSLTLCAWLGIGVVACMMNVYDSGLLWLLGWSAFLSWIFCLMGTLVGVFISDKMWGIGLALGLWFYTVAIHDAVLLMVLLSFREYPMDLTSALISGVNPVSLARVSLIMHFDAPLLLGHSGALMRRMVEQQTGNWFASAIVALWIVVPSVLGLRKFLKRDF